MSKKNRVIQHASAIAERDGGWFCHYCDAALVPTNAPFGEPPYYRRKDEYVFLAAPYKRAYCDHKMPASKGGSNKPENLVLSCLMCNSKKGTMDYETFIKKVKGLVCNE